MKFPFFSSSPARRSPGPSGSPGFTPLDIFSFDQASEDRSEEVDDGWMQGDADSRDAPVPPGPQRSAAGGFPDGDGRRAASARKLAAAPPSVPLARAAAVRSLQTPTSPGAPDARLDPRGTDGPAPSRAARIDPPPTQGLHEDLPPEGTIGAILVAARRMSVEDARRVVATQLETSAPFGEAARRLGVATEADIQFALSRQFSMPWLENGNAAVDPEIVAAFDPGHELIEQLRALRGQIAVRALHATPALRSIAIMGVEQGVGRSYVTANLATVFAQLGARTLLIDADLVNPRQHRLFKLSNRSGLSSILAGRANLSAVCPVPGLPGFAVLPSGPMPPNPHDLISRPMLGHFLRRCEQDFDVILLDTPAWNAGSSARMTALAAGAAVLLVHAGHTDAFDALEVSKEITNLGARLVGAVLNRR